MKKNLKTLQHIPKTLISGDFLKLPKVRRMYPFLLFMVVLALIWIGNTYSAIHTLQEIKTVEKELEVAKSQLQKQEGTYADISKPSRLVEELGRDKDTAKIKMAHSNTYKIIVKNEGGKNE